MRRWPIVAGLALVIVAGGVTYYGLNRSQPNYSALNFTVYEPADSGNVSISNSSSGLSYIQYDLGSSGTLTETKTGTTLVKGLFAPPRQCAIAYFSNFYLNSGNTLATGSTDGCTVLGQTSTGSPIYGDKQQPDYAASIRGNTLIIITMPHPSSSSLVSILNGLTQRKP